MALRSGVAAVKGDITDILQSGNYYVTEEIGRELSGLNNALEHLALDNTFLSTSKEWSQKPGSYTAAEANNQSAGAISAINQVRCGLSSLKNNFSKRNISGKQENQLRELHQWAMSSLAAVQGCLEPYTAGAADRIKQFGDTIGVTDRYNGYRANLTRGDRDPFRMETSWMDKQGELGRMNNLPRCHTTLGPGLDQRTTTGSVRHSPFGPVPPPNRGVLQKHIRFGGEVQPHTTSHGIRTNYALYPKSPNTTATYGPASSSVMEEVKGLNNLNAHEYLNKSSATVRPNTTGAYLRMSVQEQAGINTVFPGKTEYMYRYNTAAPNVPTPDFIINPTPNFAAYGRPMQRGKYYPTFTEYQTRYEWPDGEKIVKRPWLRN